MQQKKRKTAYKLRIGDLLLGNLIFEEFEGTRRLVCVELGNKKIVRVNIIANVIEKFTTADGEVRFSSITLDDGSGQIKARLFGEDIKNFDEINEGDTVLVIGLLRFFNNELYIIPELIKKQDPRYLLVRKLEIEKEIKKNFEEGEDKRVKSVRDQIVEIVKKAEVNEGINRDELIIKIKGRPDIINEEIKKLLEEGIIYESRPGRMRYLG